MASNVPTVQKAYDFFHKGDVPGSLKELVDDDCIWKSPGPQDKLPWAGAFQGKQQIATFFKTVAEYINFEVFAPGEMIEQGETVVVLGKLVAHFKKTGKTAEEDWVHVFKFKEGKVIFWQEYIDTAADVAAMS